LWRYNQETVPVSRFVGVGRPAPSGTNQETVPVGRFVGVGRLLL
jgi:hypothetical protein